MHPPTTSILSTPATNTNSVKNMAIESWIWNLVASRSRSFLYIHIIILNLETKSSQEELCPQKDSLSNRNQQK